MSFTLAKRSPDNCTSKEVPRSTHILRTFEAAKKKHVRDLRRNIRGPLDFSSENVENLENLEPPVNIGDLVSPKIQRRRSGGSPGIEVT